MRPLRTGSRKVGSGWITSQSGEEYALARHDTQAAKERLLVANTKPHSVNLAQHAPRSMCRVTGYLESVGIVARSGLAQALQRDVLELPIALDE